MNPSGEKRCQYQLLKANCKFIAILFKIPMPFFVDMKRSIIICNSQDITEKFQKVGGLTLPYLGTSYKATVVKTVW